MWMDRQNFPMFSEFVHFVQGSESFYMVLKSYCAVKWMDDFVVIVQKCT